VTKKSLETIIRNINIFHVSAALNLLFEIFEDERFDEIFSKFKILEILQKSVSRFKENCAKTREFIEAEKFGYVEDALTNMMAFIDYRLYSPYLR
jgi:hypothetical protein